ncbi:MAG: cupin domain-containing protein [Chloroflexota bacterium]|jgi:predicted cupin superfamily sugar epimerase
MDAKEIIEALRLKPHPREGGYFVESYRSEERINGGTLMGRYSGSRSVSTAIYYLLTPDSFSEMHRLQSDEVFHFYLGDPVEMLQLWPDGKGIVVKLGTDISAGMRPQVVVPRGVWQGARLAPGGQYALLGTTVAPGFEYVDYESGLREELLRLYPDFTELICTLTHE